MTQKNHEVELKQGNVTDENTTPLNPLYESLHLLAHTGPLLRIAAKELNSLGASAGVTERAQEAHAKVVEAYNMVGPLVSELAALRAADFEGVDEPITQPVDGAKPSQPPADPFHAAAWHAAQAAALANVGAKELGDLGCHDYDVERLDALFGKCNDAQNTLLVASGDLQALRAFKQHDAEAIAERQKKWREQTEPEVTTAA